MTDHPAEAWGEYRAAPASVLALLILASVSCWLGWYAYRGALGRLVSATPQIEVDIQPPNLPAAPSPTLFAETTPRVVIDLTASPTPFAPAPLTTSTVSGNTGIPQAQRLESQPPESQAVDTLPLAFASLPPATAPTPTSTTPTITASAAPAPLSAAPPAANEPVAPAAIGAAPTVAPQPEASTTDLLEAIGPPAPAIPTSVSGAGSTVRLPPANAGEARTQQASIANAFLPPSVVSVPAWRHFARPFDMNDPRPRIAIVITKLGLLHGATTSAIDQLPADVTLSFSPYARALDQWIGHARSLGHEVMLDLPMESSTGAADPGPQGLLTSLSAEENLQRLDWVLGRANGYVGLAGVLGDRFTASSVSLRAVLSDIARHGLMFLDPHLTNASVAPLEATRIRLPRAIADLTIDDTPDRVSIDAQLAELEHRARITGFAVGLANGYPVTIERLAEWSRGLPERNFALAPISAIADQQANR